MIKGKLTATPAASRTLSVLHASAMARHRATGTCDEVPTYHSTVDWTDRNKGLPIAARRPSTDPTKHMRALPSEFRECASAQGEIGE